MADLEPVRRRSVPDEVADQLLGRIVTGQLPAGDTLPSERDLAQMLGVSRPTVRAALQRLAGVGLVETRQGGGTTVRDFRHHAGLDLLPHLVSLGGEVDPRVVGDIIGLRSLIGPEVVAMAARAGRPADTLRRCAAAVGEAPPGVERQRAALAFWDAVVACSGSLVYRLLFNGLRVAYEPALDALSVVLAPEVDRTGDYTAIAAAVADGDAGRASALATDLLAVGQQAITRLLDQIEPSRRDLP